MRLYSIIIPVYNRPSEIRELLDTLTHQKYSNFEVIVVEDGSTEDCKKEVERFSSQLNITYYKKANAGQGFARNYGFERARGDYFIVFDSDCLIPPHYLEKVEEALQAHQWDAFGGSDKAHPDFTLLQKAISYAMTSPFTTGGIRGNQYHAGSFHPRSFNMGISRQVYQTTKGYKITRMGEDIEFSIRILAQGFRVGLVPDAFVYHKRRTSLLQFYKQLHFFGRARINISRFYPAELKLLHALPAAFLVGLFCWITTWLWAPTLFKTGAIGLGVFSLLLFVHSAWSFQSLRVGLVSVAAAFVQLIAYGAGFLQEALANTKSNN